MTALATGGEPTASHPALRPSCHRPPTGLALGEPDDKAPADDPVRRGFSIPSLTPAITGCPLEPVIGRPFGRPVGGHDERKKQRRPRERSWFFCFVIASESEAIQSYTNSRP